MINLESLEKVEKSKFGSHFTKPLYGDFCFSNIPETIKKLLGAESSRSLPESILKGLPQQYDKIVLFYIDAFGWKSMEQHLETHPLLRRIEKEGVISKITSQFPSTTAPHVVSIHSGCPVGESGIYEWYMYDPKLDSIISPLLFNFAGSEERNTLQNAGLQPGDLFPHRSLYKELKTENITSFVYQSRDYTPSPVTEAAFEGTQVLPFTSLAEVCVALLRDLKANEGPAYHFVYYDKIDSIGHQYGPESDFYHAEIRNCLNLLEEELISGMDSEKGKTLVLLTTDHGMSPTDPKNTTYLNLEFPELIPMLDSSQKGHPLVPAGGCRDFFLHLKEDKLQDAISLLQEPLAEKAEVHKVHDLLEAGFFGHSVSENLRSRVGNLVILPYYGESVWWYEKNRFEQNMLGHHGGLTREEMEIPLLALCL